MMGKKEEYALEKTSTQGQGLFTLSTITPHITPPPDYYSATVNPTKNENRLSQLICILATALILSISVSAVFVTLFLSGVANFKFKEAASSDGHRPVYIPSNEFTNQSMFMELPDLSQVARNPIYETSRGKLTRSASVTETDNRYNKLAQLSNRDYLQEVLNKITISRSVNQNGHAIVQNYIKSQMQEANWEVTTDEFDQGIYSKWFFGWYYRGQRSFTNIIATLNPSAPKKIVLACHYDSKTMGTEFVAATDSAAPCAILLNMVKHLTPTMRQEPSKISDVSVQMIFFDGEEAFYQWNEVDSLYGSRHLAQLWKQPSTDVPGKTTLETIDLFLLLDLLGQRGSMNIENYFLDTTNYYQQLKTIEKELSDRNLLQDHNNNVYFQSTMVTNRNIEDDHLPFLNEGVKVVHLIPYPFPTVWHKPTDNLSALDINTIDNFSKIMNVFVADYLGLNLQPENKR